MQSSTGRPGLPRRFHTKINLNEYWGALEKLVKVEVSFPARRHEAAAPAPVASQPPVMDVDNEVNDNLANERAEQKMEVDQDDKEEDMEVVQIKVSSPTKPPSQAVAATSLTREKRRRQKPPKDSPPRPTPTCGPATPCGAPAPSPSRRTPLGTINGMESRTQLKKGLSPLSVFADNLARRLSRQY